ncbi:hypothetical protein [Pseudalkalibacillus berkeleyi]|uniref:Uncharacterized protein n=1 Tax=Pseudalkalibacillus berkeleyi TaxID=1069813 RepID=A0ABS9H0A2_9BACL|nr:hypothetical protein [Pseudalkalibacillus berkeleyi]MCF6138437.1 hypothetical protein [Pseudalkalibacillus berkeleyi]
MLYIWNIEKIINETLLELKIDINIEFDNTLTVPMSYNVSTNTIKFNYLKVNGYKSKIKVKETEENFVKILVYHMVGYYLDSRKHFRDLRILMYGDDKEKEELRSKIDTNSWELGRTVVPESLLQSYDRVRELDKQLIRS